MNKVKLKKDKNVKLAYKRSEIQDVFQIHLSDDSISLSSKVQGDWKSSLNVTSLLITIKILLDQFMCWHAGDQLVFNPKFRFFLNETKT